MVQAVKRFVSGFVLEPVVMRPTHSLADLDKLKAATGITTASWLDLHIMIQEHHVTRTAVVSGHNL